MWATGGRLLGPAQRGFGGWRCLGLRGGVDDQELGAKALMEQSCYPLHGAADNELDDIVGCPPRCLGHYVQTFLHLKV